jgi:hypothetical protein
MVFFMERTIESTANRAEKTISTLAEVMLTVMDKLAGTQSDVKLEFRDLTLETGIVKAKMSGAVVVSLIYAKEAEPSTK